MSDKLAFLQYSQKILFVLSCVTHVVYEFLKIILSFFLYCSGYPQTLGMNVDRLKMLFHYVKCVQFWNDFIYSKLPIQVFEELMLDADWSVNAGSWMWMSCSSFFQQFFPLYCPVKFGRKADPNGDYIR